MPTSAEQAPPENARTLASAWRALLVQAQASSSVPLPPGDKDLAIAALAEFAASTVKDGQSLMLVVPDDEWLPELSNALALDLRPLCLVLPEADFAAAIALRATLSLLKSRLTRGVDDEYRAAWETQRTRLEQQADAWRQALEWSAAGRDGGAWPAQIGELFPVCILPAAQAAALDMAPRDEMLVIHAERLADADLAGLRERARRCLLLRDPSASTSRELVHIDEERRLRAELEVLAQELGEMELEFATAQAELAEFTRRYYELVGSRLAELDALQAQIARQLATRAPADSTVQQQAERAQAQAEQSQRESSRFAELDRETEKPFAPSSDLKRLFRQLAQKIHPDRAEDEDDRAWRTELMSEANRAYRSGDEMVLREILNQWQEGRPGADDLQSARSPQPGDGKPRDVAASRLARQVAQMHRRLAEINVQLNRLLASRLYELFAAANLARNRNRDLLQEMAEQLDAQLAAARQQLAQLGTD